MNLTPSKYWRVACEHGDDIAPPGADFLLPQELSTQTAPPVRGHGIAIAAYDDEHETGLFRWIGVVVGGSGDARQVTWRPCSAQIWVDSDLGRRYWKKGSFAFATRKIRDYGLHELWQEHFEDLALRDQLPVAARPAARSSTGRHVSPERLNPVEVIGEPTAGPRAGVVYLLKSAYGFKVGRTRNVPARMRAFGVQLPIVYTIPFCAWFDDCHEAERRYHGLFEHKRINGEWFDLDDADIEVIRRRA